MEGAIFKKINNNNWVIFFYTQDVLSILCPSETGLTGVLKIRLFLMGFWLLLNTKIAYELHKNYTEKGIKAWVKALQWQSEKFNNL